VIFPFLPEPPGSPTLADLGLCLALGLAQLTLGATLLATSAAAVAADAAWASALAPNLCGLLVSVARKKPTAFDAIFATFQASILHIYSGLPVRVEWRAAGRLPQTRLQEERTGLDNKDLIRGKKKPFYVTL
jgi:hypothetical protein